MITDIQLPDFDVPDLETPKISDEQYLAWIDQQLSELVELGVYDELARSEHRCPVDARFRLPADE